MLANIWSSKFDRGILSVDLIKYYIENCPCCYLMMDVRWSEGGFYKVRSWLISMGLAGWKNRSHLGSYDVQKAFINFNRLTHI